MIGKLGVGFYVLYLWLNSWYDLVRHCGPKSSFFVLCCLRKLVGCTQFELQCCNYKTMEHWRRKLDRFDFKDDIL